MRLAFGASTLFNYEECENEFQEGNKMMHLKAKTTLTNKQNRQGKYAVPVGFTRRYYKS